MLQINQNVILSSQWSKQKELHCTHIKIREQSVTCEKQMDFINISFSA